MFAIGLEEGHLPLKRNNHGDALSEEQRVLLVMLSRARHGLIVTRTERADGPYGSYAATESRWWKGINAEFSSLEQVEAHLEASITAS